MKASTIRSAIACIVLLTANALSAAPSNNRTAKEQAQLESLLRGFFSGIKTPRGVFPQPHPEINETLSFFSRVANTRQRAKLAHHAMASDGGWQSIKMTRKGDRLYFSGTLEGKSSDQSMTSLPLRLRGWVSKGGAGNLEVQTADISIQRLGQTIARKDAGQFLIERRGDRTTVRIGKVGKRIRMQFLSEKPMRTPRILRRR